MKEKFRHFMFRHDDLLVLGGIVLICVLCVEYPRLKPWNWFRSAAEVRADEASRQRGLDPGGEFDHVRGR